MPAAKTPPKPKTPKKVDIKTKPTEVPVDDFIAAVPNATRKADAKVLLALMKKVTGEAPKMWGPTIVGFGASRYVTAGGREGEMLTVGFSPRGANLVLYVRRDFAGADALLARLGKHKASKACLYVSKLADVDLTVLEELIARSLTAKSAAAC